MAGYAERDVARAGPTPPDTEMAALWARMDDLSGALEHVLDVLEALAESHEHIDWHVEEARTEISGRH